jgi:N6-L-threonylcarbamoyladenine synthase
MIILAIETSCDETAISLVKIKNKKFSVLSNIISSQAKLHAQYGGVYPFLAKREHQKNLPIVLKKAINQALKKEKFTKPDLISLTVGPGLEPCLWTGINFSKDLAKKLKIPIVPVNHIKAHILTNFINLDYKKTLPAICLVVSGGHSQLVLIKKLDQMKIIGQTRDDAAGECFDKAARIIGLDYPGGPAIAEQAGLWRIKNQPTKYQINLPRPMINQKNYDFSFSGLKTAVLNNFKSQPIKTRKQKQYIQEMAGQVEQAIIDVLIKKTIKAAKDFKVKTIILAGGVAANKQLRQQLEKKIKKDLNNVKYLKPDINLCTDNAVMVAVNGYYQRKDKLLKEKQWQKIKANANLKV